MADDFWQNDPVVKAAGSASPAVIPAGDDWWHGDPVAQPAQPSMAMDVAKSAGTGLVKGAESLLGLPADIQMGLGNLVGKGVLSLGDLIGLARPSDQTPEDLIKGAHSKVPLAQRYAPTSENIGKAVEAIAGPLHTPETTPGRYAETIGEFAPGAVAMGPAEGLAGAAANATKLAAIPGAASEALGEKFQGTWAEPYARLLGAIGGGAVGPMAGKVGEMMANRAAGATAAETLGGQAVPAAVRKVAQNFEADKLTPQIAAQRASDLGPEAMMLDVGRQLGGRAEAIASQPGKGQNKILDAVEQRVHGVDQFGNVQAEFGQETANRIKDTLDQTMGPSPDLVATKNHINNVVDQVAKPLYDRVMTANPVVNVPSSITSRPVVAQAMKDAEQLAKNHGENITGTTETQTELAGPGYHIANEIQNPAQTSLRYWDYVKKALDSRVNGMMKSGGIQDLDSAGKADLSGLLDAKNALINHLDNVTAGAYAMARKASATKFEVNDAIDMGRSALNTKLLPEELADQMNGMSLPEREGVKTGMRREVDRIIDTARNDGAAARRVLDTNQNREKIAHVFGQDAADAIDNRIAAETKFQTAANRIAGSSRTGVRSQLVKDTEAPSAAQPPTANVAGLALAGLRRGREYLGDIALERTKEGIADLLTRRGQDIPRLAQVLSQYNAARAANAATPIGRQAGGLAGVIASQSPGWFNGFLPGPRANQGQ